MTISIIYSPIVADAHNPLNLTKPFTERELHSAARREALRWRYYCHRNGFDLRQALHPYRLAGLADCATWHDAVEQISRVWILMYRQRDLCLAAGSL